MFALPRLFLHAPPLLFLLVCAGCSTTGSSNPPAESAAEEAETVEVVQWLPPKSRVAMLPIFTEQAMGNSRQDMDAIFRGELMKTLNFEVVQISRRELQSLIDREQIASTEAIPPLSLRALRDKYGVDAVLFTDFTLYRPYRPLAIGARSKLVSMDTLEVLWAADRVVDSANPATAEAALRFGDPGASNPTRANQLILQSPRRFAGFVAHEIFSTLPVPESNP